MPDQNLPKPPELPTPAPASQAEVQRYPGPDSLDEEINPMQSSYTPPQSSAPPGRNPDQAPQRIPYWLQQAERFLRVIVRMYLGLLVTCAPWYPAAWDNNPLFTSSPWLAAFITHGAVRGVVSGLGILNLWIAVRDALRSTASPDSR